MSSWPHADRVCAEPASPFQPPHSPKYSPLVKAGLVTLAMGAGACAIAFDSNDLGACIAATVFWLLFYLVFLHCVIDHFEWTREHNSDGSTKAELYVSLFHQLVLMGGILVALLALHVDDDWSSWWKGGPVYAFTLERQVQLSIFGYELKDFEFGCIHWTWIVHHSITLAGCIFVLFMPAGLGLVTLNGIVAELGSGVYNIQIMFPSNATKISYFVLMFISNGIVVVFMGLLFLIDELGNQWKAVYAVIVILLFLLRTEGIRRGVCEFISEDGDDKDLQKESEQDATASAAECTAEGNSGTEERASAKGESEERSSSVGLEPLGVLGAPAPADYGTVEGSQV